MCYSRILFRLQNTINTGGPAEIIMETLTEKFEKILDKRLIGLTPKELVHDLMQAVRNRDALIAIRHPKNIEELLKEMEQSY